VCVVRFQLLLLLLLLLPPLLLLPLSRSLWLRGWLQTLVAIRQYSKGTTTD
jgi:hypothetical protein